MSGPHLYRYDPDKRDLQARSWPGWAYVDGVYRTPPWLRMVAEWSGIMPLIHCRPLVELLAYDQVIDGNAGWDALAGYTCRRCHAKRQPCACYDFPPSDAMHWAPGDPVLRSQP